MEDSSLKNITGNLPDDYVQRIATLEGSLSPADRTSLLEKVAQTNAALPRAMQRDTRMLQQMEEVIQKEERVADRLESDSKEEEALLQIGEKLDTDSFGS